MSISNQLTGFAGVRPRCQSGLKSGYSSTNIQQVGDEYRERNLNPFANFLNTIESFVYNITNVMRQWERLPESTSEIGLILNRHKNQLKIVFKELKRKNNKEKSQLYWSFDRDANLNLNDFKNKMCAVCHTVIINFDKEKIENLSLLLCWTRNNDIKKRMFKLNGLAEAA